MSMLHEFLLAERDNILALCTKKVLSLSDYKASSEEMHQGLPVFYDELIDVLRLDVDPEWSEKGSSEVRLADEKATDNLRKGSALQHGKESLRLGYTISQVVHGYGAICQAITEYSALHGNQPISDREFNRMNLCLDVAISEAVTEFSRIQTDVSKQEQVRRLGSLAHELGNALSGAIAAHRMIQRGMVGIGGSTSALLENYLWRMKEIINRSLSEVRLRGEHIVERARTRVIDLVSEVEITGAFEATAKSVCLKIDVPPDLIVNADRHLVVSALFNLVQNAVKFTPSNGTVCIRAKSLLDRVLIEVEDGCGGLPHGKIDELFRPFVQKGTDKSGVGLGLSIARRAIAENDGQVSARDIPGKGCVFTIDLPADLSIPANLPADPLTDRIERISKPDPNRLM